MKLVYNDALIAELSSCADFDECLYSKVYFILFTLSANHYNVNGTPHSKLFEMALEDCGAKDADTPSLEALVSLANNRELVRLFCEYLIADMTVLIKPGVMSGTNMYFQKVRELVRANEDASSSDSTAAKRQRTDISGSSSAPRWKFINIAYIGQTHRVQMLLTPAKESRIVENTVDKINNASHLFTPVADVLALLARDEIPKYSAETIFGHIAEMSIVTFEHFRYFGCKGGLSNPTAAPSHTNPIVVQNPLPIVFVAKIHFDCANMVRIYKPKDGDAGQQKKLGGETNSGSESLLISPQMTEDRLDELNAYFGNLPNSSVNHIFKTGRDGWNVHDPKAFINIHKDCKLYIPSGLNRKVRGMKPRDYKLPSAADIAADFSAQLNNNFFEHFSAFEESTYLQKNQFEETELAEKTRLLKEIVKEQPELNELYFTVKEQTICGFIGTPRYFFLRNLAKDYSTIQLARTLSWKAPILANYQNFNDNIYYSCSTDAEREKARASYYKEAATTKILTDGISKCVSMRRYFDYNEPVFSELDGKLVRVLVVAVPRSLSAKMKLVVESIIPFAIESGDDDPNQAARSSLSY